MIKYEDIVRRISVMENKKIKNEERIKTLSEENNTLTENLKSEKRNAGEDGSGSCRTDTR